MFGEEPARSNEANLVSQDHIVPFFAINLNEPPSAQKAHLFMDQSSPQTSTTSELDTTPIKERQDEPSFDLDPPTFTPPFPNFNPAWTICNVASTQGLFSLPNRIGL